MTFLTSAALNRMPSHLVTLLLSSEGARMVHQVHLCSSPMLRYHHLEISFPMIRRGSETWVPKHQTKGWLHCVSLVSTWQVTHAAYSLPLFQALGTHSHVWKLVSGLGVGIGHVVWHFRNHLIFAAGVTLMAWKGEMLAI